VRQHALVNDLYNGRVVRLLPDGSKVFSCHDRVS
jgi:hypothetical protein